MFLPLRLTVNSAEAVDGCLRPLLGSEDPLEVRSAEFLSSLEEAAAGAHMGGPQT